MLKRKPKVFPGFGLGLGVDELLEATKKHYKKLERAAAALDGERVRDLCLNRESDKYGHAECEGIAAQLAGIFSELPGIQAVAEIGVAPLMTKVGTVTVIELDEVTGLERKTEVKVTPLEEGEGVHKVRAVLFAYRGVHYLYSLASAATIDEKGDQLWTNLLVKVLAWLRPINLRTVHMSRYVRNQDAAGTLLNACGRHVKYVWLGMLRLEMKGERAATDKMLFLMLATAAAIERDSTVARLLAGKVNAINNGVWVSGPDALPMGYKVDQAGKFVPDGAKRELVREVLVLIASQPTPREFVIRLGDLGVTMAAIEHSGVPERSIRHAQDAVRVWEKYVATVPLWLTGEYMIHCSNPFPGAKKVAGTEVTRNPDGTEELTLVMRPGLPEGGWAEAAVLDAAFAVAVDVSSRVELSQMDDGILAQLSSPQIQAMVASLGALRKRKSIEARHALPWTRLAWQTGGGLRWKLKSRRGANGRPPFYDLIRWSENWSIEDSSSHEGDGAADGPASWVGGSR